MTHFTMPKTFTPDEYATLGSEIDTSEDPMALGEFFQRHHGSGDVIIHRLAIIANARASAVIDRLAGRIASATRHESHIEREYAKLPEDCRW